ncbi:MAG: serine/threonine protein kinase [Planctomycetota bacterium]
MHPERIGPYKIYRKIGAGGMGNVYFGVHEATVQQAAIKVLPASMAREEGFVQRFHREIDALRQLSNRHIVQFYQDGTTDDGTFYYAMEFVDGVTLTEEITDRKRLPWKEVIELSLQIAAALKAAHDAGIIHRDLKPSNLMLTPDRTIKLTDFGVASLFASSRLTRAGGVVGTAEYMSPEQARGQRATRRSDLYSLGAVMYAMLTGRPPFTGPTANDILQKHQFAQFDLPTRYVPEVPRLLEEMVCQLLDKDPAKRLPDALVVMKRLEQIRNRIELAEQNLESETLERPLPGATVVSEAHEREVDDHQPGTATMVRNMIRDDVKSSLIKSPVARFFDNVFVLITMFTLVVLFGLWMNRRNTPSTKDHLYESRAIFEKDASPAWLRARDELLQPLLSSGLSSEDMKDVQSMISEANDYEFSRSLKVDPKSSKDENSEVHRLIRAAFESYEAGDSLAAREQLDAIQIIVQQTGGSGYLVKFLTETRSQWEKEPLTTGRTLLLKNVISNVMSQSDKIEDTKEIRRMLEAIILLYGNDRAVESEMTKIREMLSTIVNRQNATPEGP